MKIKMNHRKNLEWFYSLIPNLLNMIIRPYIHKIDGMHNIPKDKPFIVAANHASYIDDFIITTFIIKYTKKKTNIFINSRYFKNDTFGKILNNLGGIAVDVYISISSDKKRKQTNERAFKKAVDGLKKGELFAIFPEGGRSEEGIIKKAKTGVARVALVSKVPVIPVGIKGSYQVMPKGSIFPRFKRLDVVFGKPMLFDKYYGKEKDYKTLRKVTTLIMKNIAKLTGQKYNY